MLPTNVSLCDDCDMLPLYKSYMVFSFLQGHNNYQFKGQVANLSAFNNLITDSKAAKETHRQYLNSLRLHLYADLNAAIHTFTYRMYKWKLI